MSADLTATEAELLAAAQALYSFGSLFLEFSAEVGMWGVWTVDDLIGAGVTKSEAIAEATAQLRQWEAP